MRQATAANITSARSSNVVALPLAETHVTRAEGRASRQAASVLPPWFAAVLIEDEDIVAGRRQDHIRLERIAGPPIGCFEIWREARGRLLVYATGEPDEDVADFAEIGRCRSLPAAFEIVRRDLAATIASWGLVLAPRNGPTAAVG